MRNRLQRRLVSSATEGCEMKKEHDNCKSRSTRNVVDDFAEEGQALGDKRKKRGKKGASIKVLSFSNNERVRVEDELGSVLHGFDWMHFLHQPASIVSTRNAYTIFGQK